MDHLTQQQGKQLLHLARATLEQKISGKGAVPLINDHDLLTKRGTFVTLMLNNQLRGCIGNIDPVKTIRDGVGDNAVHAAIHDQRFLPLSAEELDRVVIGISILSTPSVLVYDDDRDLLDKLSSRRVGVILRRGSKSATFLPQVWEQLPDPEAFLASLCRKAGLSADCWREKDTEILTYQVQKFEEVR